MDTRSRTRWTAANHFANLQDARTYADARARGEAPALALYRVRTEQACRETLTIDLDGWSDPAAPYGMRELEAVYDVDAAALERHTRLRYVGATGVDNLTRVEIGDPRLTLPPGATVRLYVYHDGDSTPDDADCYSPEDVQAWRDDAWHYVGTSAVVTLADGTTGEAAVWGMETGDYWPGTDEADVWEPVEELIGEALAAALEAAPDVSAVIGDTLSL